jgi:hypothetical protein
MALKKERTVTMNNKLKVTLIIGIIILIGGVAASATGYIYGGVKSIAMMNGRLKAIDPNDSSRMEKVDEAFDGVSAISVDVESMSNVTVKEGPAVSVKGQNPLDFGGLKAELSAAGTLAIENSVDMEDSFSFIFNFPGIFSHTKFDSSFVEITVPRTVSLAAINLDVGFGDVNVNGASAGAINVVSESGSVNSNGLTCDTFDVSSSFGDVDVVDVKAREAAVKNASGSVGITNLSASGRLSVDSYFGDIAVKSANTGETHIESDSGSVSIVSLSAPSGLDVKSSFGDVSFTVVDAGASKIEMESGDFTADTMSVTGGMNLDSNFGEINFSGDLQGASVIKSESGEMSLALGGSEADYFITAESGSGEVAIGGRKFGGYEGYTEKGAQTAPNRIDIRSGYGDVDVRFNSR